MKIWEEIGRRLGTRERVLAILALVFVLAVAADQLIIGPYISYKAEAEEKLTARVGLLKRYEGVLADKEALLEQVRSAQKLKAAIERKFVAAGTEALASADLQKKIKDMADRTKVTVTKSSSFAGVPLTERKDLRLLPMTFEVRSRTMSALSALLYEIEYEKNVLFFVDELFLSPVSGKGVRGRLRVNAIVRVEG